MAACFGRDNCFVFRKENTLLSKRRFGPSITPFYFAKTPFCTDKSAFYFFNNPYCGFQTIFRIFATRFQ